VVGKPEVIQLDEKSISDLDPAGGLESGVLGNGSFLVAQRLPTILRFVPVCSWITH
jgi:hypothetical protein